MTIKEFSKLCGCNPQTLRYYDRVQLLRPGSVDQWSGYRYYDESQAEDFIKIKNLQRAGFTITEIKELIKQNDLAMTMAFDRKIEEAERRLREMKDIRMSYLTEMSNIKEKIKEIRTMIASSMQEYDPYEEFGISKEKYAEFTSEMKRMLDENADIDFDIEKNADNADYPENEKKNPLSDPDYSVVYEKHGWKNVKDFLDEFCCLSDGGVYSIYAQLEEKKEKSSMGFSCTLLGILLEKNENKKKTVTCNTEESKDGLNHFWLLKRK